MLDKILWLLPSQVLCFQLAGNMTLEDLVQIQTLIDENADIKLGDSFDLVIDFSRCQGYSADLLNLRSLTGLIRKHPQLRWFVIVDPTPHPMARFLGLITIKMAGINFLHVHQEEQALDFLKKLGPSL